MSAFIFSIFAQQSAEAPVEHTPIAPWKYLTQKDTRSVVKTVGHHLLFFFFFFFSSSSFLAQVLTLVEKEMSQLS